MKLANLLLVACLLPATALAAGVAKGPKGPLRTAYTHVTVAVDGDVARTTVTQVFVNDLPGPVEVSYGFPLPEDAVVTGFADWRDGKRIEAGVSGREDAREKYEAAAAAGKPAALGETEEGHRFRMNLFAVPGGGSRRVELRYSQTLAALGGERTYVFPNGTDDPDPTLLDLEVGLAADRKLLSLDSLNHEDARIVEAGPSRRVVHLSRTKAGLGRDFVLRWRQETEPLDLAARAVRPDVGQPAYVEARFAFNADPFSVRRSSRDVVVLVDASLSMAGEPLDHAKALALGTIDALAPGDRFNLVVFNQLVTQAFETLAPADDEHRKQARALLADLRAGGRTDLQDALGAAGEMLRTSGDGLVVLATDGQPTATPGADAFALNVDPAPFANARVVVAQFNYPSRSADLEALFPSVTVRYVPDGPAADRAIGALVRLATAPVIEDLGFEVQGGELVHGALPARLAVGESVRLMGRADSDVVVRVYGRLEGLPVWMEQKVAVPAEAGPDLGLPVEWARLRVRDLEAEWGRLHDSDPPAAETVEAEIRGLGTEYKLATRFTSYVLTDGLAPDDVKPGDPEIRVHAPRSAHGVRGLLPWGEEIRCSWSPEEGLWLGRFLVPRGVKDGLYRVRIFVDTQKGTDYRGALWFRVDSRPPKFELALDEDGPAMSGDVVRVVAWPVVDVTEGKDGDRVDPDPIDLRKIVVQVGEWEFPLERVGEVWTAEVPLDLPPGRHVLRLLATDRARNTSEASVAVEVE
jgi:Ca-activated chloride channel family protein